MPVLLSWSGSASKQGIYKTGDDRSAAGQSGCVADDVCHAKVALINAAAFVINWRFDEARKVFSEVSKIYLRGE